MHACSKNRSTVQLESTATQASHDDIQEHKQCRLLALPKELRLTIYELVLEDAEDFILPTGLPIRPSLLKVNRQITDEISNLYYKLAHFHARVKGKDTGIAKFVEAAGSDNIAKIRSFTLDFNLDALRRRIVELFMYMDSGLPQVSGSGVAGPNELWCDAEACVREVAMLAAAGLPRSAFTFTSGSPVDTHTTPEVEYFTVERIQNAVHSFFDEGERKARGAGDSDTDESD